ncbi:MAG: ABC transporter permease [Bdellovibrionaceae bacterium]|nr:ABC transporter permease [Pseudobdellovibrionaceae bacterium]
MKKTSVTTILGAFIIGLFVFLSLAAPGIKALTGLDPDAQNVFSRYQKPWSRGTVSQDNRENTIEKLIQRDPLLAQSVENSLKEKSLVKTDLSGEALFELALMPVPEAISILEKIDSPEATEIKKIFHSFELFHLFGTDELGRDVFIRLIFGARVSMAVGILVALMAALIGLLIGSVAGFYGGLLDTILMRTTDALLSLPLLPVMIVVAAIDLQKLPLLPTLVNAQNESILKMILILCLFSWMTVARLVRGNILSLREQDFILAARALGASNFSIITRHLLPNVIGSMLVAISLGVGESILFEAALSFLGLGIQPPTPSWGNMLFNAQELIYQSPLLAILPGLMILLTVMSFNYLGDGLQDALDPKARGR